MISLLWTLQLVFGLNLKAGGPRWYIFDTFLCAGLKISKYTRTCMPSKCYGVLGGSLSEITLYSGHTSAPKVASQFSPWKNPESNVSSNYLLFALSFCKHIEKFLWLGEEKNISEIRNNNQNNKLSPKSSKFDFIKLHKSKFSFCDVYFQSWWTLKMIPNLWRSPRCGGDAFGCASKFPVSHHHLQRNCPKFSWILQK